VIVQHLLLPVQIRAGPDVVWQVDDGRCPDFRRTYRRGSGGRSASLFRRWLAVVDKPIDILGEDVEHKRARTFIGSIVDSTAGVAICDLRRGGACDPRIRGVSYITYWSFMLIRRSYDPVYFYVANVGFNAFRFEA